MVVMIGEVVKRYTEMGRTDKRQERVFEKLNRQHPVEDVKGTTLGREVVLRRRAHQQRSRYTEIPRRLLVAEGPLTERNVHETTV